MLPGALARIKQSKHSPGVNNSSNCQGWSLLWQAAPPPLLPRADEKD